MLSPLVAFLRKASRWLFWPGVALVVWGELTPHPPSIPGVWDKSEHFTAYFGLAAMATLGDRAAARAGGGAAGDTGRWGESLEIIQGLVGRDRDWLDMLANTIGTLAGFAVAAILLALVGSRPRD